jgi:hypothetical protein
MASEGSKSARNERAAYLEGGLPRGYVTGIKINDNRDDHAQNGEDDSPKRLRSICHLLKTYADYLEKSMEFIPLLHDLH